MHGGAIMDIDVTPIYVTVTREPFSMTAERIKNMVFTDCINLYTVSPHPAHAVTNEDPFILT